MNREVLLLGSNYYNALSAVRSLGKNNIPFSIAEYDLNSYSLKSKYFNKDNLLKINKLSPSTEKDLLSKLITWAKSKSHKPILIATHDNYMLFVDKYLHELKDYFLITLQEQGLATNIMIKSNLHKLAEKNGLNVPLTLNINLNNIDDEVFKIEKYLEYPLIIKPGESAPFVAKFRKKVFEIYNREQLIEHLSLIKLHNFECVAQQVIKGSDEHMLLYDAYVDSHGNINHEFTGQKLRQWPIKFGASCFMHSKINPELAEIGRNFLKSIKWRGFAEIEFKQDAENGKYYIIEINARHTNFNQLLVDMGFDITMLTFQDLYGLELIPNNFAQAEQPDFAFCYSHEDRHSIRSYIDNGLYSKDKIKEQNKNKIVTYAIWNPMDPLPFFKYCFNKLITMIKNKK